MVLARRDLEGALQGGYQIHPLWTLDLLTLVNLRDPSALVVPAASYSVSADVFLRGGVFISFGDSHFALPAWPASECVGVPDTGYLSLSWFF